MCGERLDYLLVVVADVLGRLLFVSWKAPITAPYETIGTPQERAHVQVRARPPAAKGQRVAL